MENILPFVSAIIPCRNEEKHIGKCLDSLISQDYPKERLEIIVADGMSEDKTKSVVNEYGKNHSFIRIIANQKKIIPCALNLGIRNAKGELIVRMDAHATYEFSYISKCVEYLLKYKADNVGGTLKTVPADGGIAAKAIAAAISSSFGAGSAYFRTGAQQIREVDTVFGGCYRKEIFDKIGFFNENLARSEDMEFNLRLKKAGGKILLVPEIIAYYYPKTSLNDFFRHNFNDGVWAIYPLKFGKISFGLRHYLPFAFVLTVFSLALLGFFNRFFWLFFFAVIAVYLLASFYFSFQKAVSEREWKLGLLLPWVFFLRHFGYGLGSLWGLKRLL